MGVGECWGSRDSVLMLTGQICACVESTNRWRGYPAVSQAGQMVVYRKHRKEGREKIFWSAAYKVKLEGYV